jgi:hypothetical protein
MSELERLKDILLVDERAERDRQQQDLAAKLQTHFEELPGALPDLLKRAQHDERLVRALEKPLSLGLERMARTQKTLLISILFPLIGPIIRRSIAETLSTLVRDMNRAVEHSISPTGLRWRWEAMRTGVPFAQVVLKHTLRYRVEHLLLVNNMGGLLVAHVANDNAALADSDAVAAMLSALQDFARDAVLASADESLSSVEVGGMTLKILRGPLMHLAVAVRGEMTEQAQDRLEELLESLHQDISAESDIESQKADLLGLMRDWLLKNGQESSEAQDDAKSESEAKPAPAWLVTLGILIAAGLFAWLITHFWHNRQAARLQQALIDTPGFSVRVEHHRGRYQIFGARDPQADTPESIAKRINVDLQRLDTAHLVPQLSLETELWKRRLERTGRLPHTMQVRALPDKVLLQGELSNAELRQIQMQLQPWETLVAFDLSQVRVASPAMIRQRLTLMRRINLLSVQAETDLGRQAELQILIEQLQKLADLAPEYTVELRLALRKGGQSLVNQLQVQVPKLRIDIVEAKPKQSALLQVTHVEMLPLYAKAR